MKERPIICNAREVRAIESGAMTQFRRIVKPQPAKVTRGSSICGLPVPIHPDDYAWPIGHGCVTVSCKPNGPTGWAEEHSPYGQPGDRLWVRAWCVGYAADGCEGKMRPSTNMPRWASRITLEITSVRVERLQSISEADAWAEGVAHFSAGMNGTPSAGDHDAGRVLFRRLWESINGPGSWDANPWLWVVEFRRIEE